MSDRRERGFSLLEFLVYQIKVMRLQKAQRERDIREKELLLDGGFKKQVLDEMPDEVNLRAATRIYIEAISRIHKQARERIEEIVDTSRLYLDRAIRDYMVIYEKEPIGLYAYEYQDTKKTDEVLVLTKWDDVRRELVKRNGELVNLGKRYVSSQAHNK